MPGTDYLKELRALEAALAALPAGQVIVVRLPGHQDLTCIRVTRLRQVIEVQVMDHQGHFARPSDIYPDPCDFMEKGWSNAGDPAGGQLPAFEAAMLLAGAAREAWDQAHPEPCFMDVESQEGALGMDPAIEALRRALCGLVEGFAEPEHDRNYFIEDPPLSQPLRADGMELQGPSINLLNPKGKP